MRAEGVGKEWRGLESKGGQLPPGKGPEEMGIRHHEQDIGLPSKLGFFSSFSQRVRLMIKCVLCKYKQDFMCRLKINHAWNASSSCIQFLGNILVVAIQLHTSTVTSKHCYTQALLRTGIVTYKNYYVYDIR
jgi:hypothetical protein